jgi:hypothetical protein
MPQFGHSQISHPYIKHTGSRVVTGNNRPKAAGGYSDMITAKRPFAAFGRLKLLFGESTNGSASHGK